MFQLTHNIHKKYCVDWSLLHSSHFSCKFQTSPKMDISYQQVLPAVVFIVTNQREATLHPRPQVISVKVPLQVQEWCLVPFSKTRGWT